MSNYGANPYRTMLGEMNHTQDTPQVPTPELVDPGPGSGVVGEWGLGRDLGHHFKVGSWQVLETNGGKAAQ